MDIKPVDGDGHEMYAASIEERSDAIRLSANRNLVVPS
jgi:hypothetical protein